MEAIHAHTVDGKQIDPNDYSESLSFSANLVSFFNLRSFDRIAYSQQLKQQEEDSGVDFLQADMALGLNIQKQSNFELTSQTVIGYSPLGAGDALDRVTHEIHELTLHDTSTPKKKQKQFSVDEFFGFGKDGNSMKSTEEKVRGVVDQFVAQAGKEDKVDATVAQHALESSRNVIDAGLIGDEKDVVKNFVSEELYIHTKVHCSLTVLMKLMIVDGIESAIAVNE